MNALKHLLPAKHVFPCCFRTSRGICGQALDSSKTATMELHTQEHEVVIALGSNVGDRVRNFNEALQLMKKSGIKIIRHGCLYETAPAYMTDQPHFLNSAVRAVTKLGPHELLSVLKNIEKEMGRTKGIRYGPRPLDLDILFYGKFRIDSDILTVPHERIWERPFVVAPLLDLLGSVVDNDTVACWHSLSVHSGGIFGAWEKLGGEKLVGKDGMKRVLPIGNKLWDWSEKTHVMGVLNLTPDSFSDGGKFHSLDSAISRVHSMISEGADIIDIGAQSTRPMASRISTQEELDRLIPILETVIELPEMEGKMVSVDIFDSKVASEAIGKGVHLVNDVSAGNLDSNMLRIIAESKVPYIAMHMRGNPCTMQNEENLRYNDVCKDVASELHERVGEAEVSGIPAWRIMLDPGIGFSKKTQQNLEILMNLPKIREQIARKSLGLSHVPLLVGPSRKRFLGDVCGRPTAVDRDPATVAAVSAAVLNGANVVRVHNVRDNVDAVRLCDAMQKRGSLQKPS